jgi:hypothetical protein
MSNGFLLMISIDDRLGQILHTHITEKMYECLGNSVNRGVLSELCDNTFRDMVSQVVMNTSDDHSDFCFNLLSLPNYSGLRFGTKGEIHPFAYRQERELTGLSHALKDLGLFMFFAIARHKPQGMYLVDVKYVDQFSIGLIYKPNHLSGIIESF